MIAIDKNFDTLTFEKVGGNTVGVRRSSGKPHRKTIVLIHGIGVSSAYFVPFAQELAQNYTVIALDLPGYGKTPKPARPLTIEQLASTVHLFLQKHHITDPTLVGHSMGCQIITHLNKKARGRIHKMILLAPTVNRKERSVLKQGLRLLQDTFFEAPVVNRVIFSDYVRMGIPRYFQTSRWMINDHIDSTLADNSTPTLIVRGANDYIVPREWATFLQQISLCHSLAEITGAPHALQYKYAKQTASVCQNFIEN